MKKIEIVSVPQGTAPIKMREAWIGCIFSVYLPQLQHGRKRGGFAIDPDQAIKELRKHNPQAADWWTNNKFEHPSYAVEFEPDCCQELLKKIKKPLPI